MGVWRVPADVMATSRFAISPRAEVVGALGALTRPRSPEQRVFGAAHGAAFSAWVASRPGSRRPGRRELPRPRTRPGRLDGRLPEPPARGRRRDFRERARPAPAADGRRGTRRPARDHAGSARAGPDAARRPGPGGRAGGLALDPHRGDRLGPSRADPAGRHRLADRPARPARVGHGAAGPRPRPRVGRRRPAPDQPLRPAAPHAAGGQHPAVRADAHRRHLGRVVRRQVRALLPRRRAAGPGRRRQHGRPRAARRGRAGPRCSPCSTPRAAPPSSRPSAARRSARSAATSRCCWRPASCFVAGRVARCSTGAPRWATRSSPPARRPEDRTAVAAAAPT